MSTPNLTALNRSTIGFDRIPELLRPKKSGSEADHFYPPYNIEKTADDRYRVIIALAGFNRDDINIFYEQHRLTVRGKMAHRGEVEYLHRGIPGRAFERCYELDEYIEVMAANFDNGLLTIELHRITPEKSKPQQIQIREPERPSRSTENVAREAA